MKRCKSFSSSILERSEQKISPKLAHKNLPVGNLGGMESLNSGNVDNASAHFFFIDESSQNIKRVQSGRREEAAVARDEAIRADVVGQGGAGWRGGSVSH